MLRQYDPFAALLDDWRPFRGANGQQSMLRPAVDVFEDDSAMHVTIELPGLRAEDVDIEVNRNVLSISGERRLENEQSTGGYHRIERRYGRFTRTFTLPDTIDASAISADMSEGLLRLLLPKRPEARPRKIEVGAGDRGSAGDGKVEVQQGSASA